MSDLIGRFLNMDELIGRGLVKFTYFIGLFYVIVFHLYEFVRHLVGLEFGALLLVPFQLLFWILVIRLVAEALITLLSISESVEGVGGIREGFEAGLTPDKHQQKPDRPKDPEPSANDSNDAGVTGDGADSAAPGNDRSDS